MKLQLKNSLLSLLIFTGCFQGSADELKSGDLIFQISGTSEFSKAISDATYQNDSLDFVHVGIIEVREDGQTEVIEANPTNGVRIVPLEEFIHESYRIAVKRLTVAYSIDKMLENAHSYLGQQYDWWYLPDNGKMYCSELVYESFIDSEGHPIFEAEPMNFRASDGSMPEFWIKLFEKLDSPIPEGVLGTNPNSLARSPLLRPVTYP